MDGLSLISIIQSRNTGYFWVGTPGIGVYDAALLMNNRTIWTKLEAALLILFLRKMKGNRRNPKEGEERVSNFNTAGYLLVLKLFLL